MMTSLENTLKNLLQKKAFVEYNKDFFLLTGGYEINYYSCKRGIENSSSKNNIFATYYIIDLTDPQTNNVCSSTILQSFDSFSEFQNKYLSKVFFFENDSLRYNLYLVFICDANEKEQIRNKTVDYNFARKLVFSINDFEEYFDFFSQKNNLTKKAIKTEQEMLDSIKKMVSYLQVNQCKSLLVPLKETRDLFEYCMIHNKRFDSSKMAKLKPDDFIKEYFYQQPSDFIPQKNRVKNINIIHMNNFRTNCFRQSEEIIVGAVNIIYGDNTAGKSSILDAIEFGFTGKTHKNKEDDTLQGAYVDIYGDHNTFISSNHATKMENQLKDYWYKNKIGELNELFCRVNYFNTDATYRFALEDGNSDDAIHHIKNLLCNSKLIEMEKLLSEKEFELKRIFEFLDFTSKEKKEFRETQKRKKKEKKVFFKVKITKDDTILDFKKEMEKSQRLLSISEEVHADINRFINKQLESNLELINLIFHRLYSFESNIIWRDNTILEQKANIDSLNTIQTMSTAQKICLALSVIFCQFFISESAPRIILLDESVANFDSEHLLNLLDFLRDIALNGIQVFFTTANSDIAKICNNKFAFFDQYCLYKVSKDKSGKTIIESKNT